MTSASPSEENDSEDPENPSGQKKKKKKKTRRPGRRRSQEAKAIATSKIMVNLPEFTGKDLKAWNLFYHPKPVLVANFKNPNRLLVFPSY